MMNLMHWKLLVAVADAGNVSRAAEAFGITQSGASQAISQMEAALGVQVFVRERKHTSVTALGEQVLVRARRMVAELESIQNLVDASRGCHLGRIRLATFPSLFASLLPPLLHSFKRLHPGIEVICLEGTDEEVESWLATGDIDLGVVMNPAAHRSPLMLGHDRWVAAVPSEHTLARRGSLSPVTLAQLVDEPFVVATGGCHLHGQRLVQQAGLQLSNVRLTVRDWNTAFALVGEGMGVSIVPASTLPEDLRSLRVYDLDPPIYRRFGLVGSSADQPSPATQALLRHVRKSAPDISVANDRLLES
ncbi:LysR family transcriptional regulator [Pseudomonas rubra]|uniref:LysR family transcriptional regulator n=1 Tax=Pseudomonas rubra TaxID=2942627 RepID=A0ABT5P9V4_9PSED|nr:LysR family transcriptional regulator [Pseudomonas rubra]MDD1014942.1 LysR family transcriptional regulator [Pseudomonas rubra]MDD1041311.1 LysR family transcriptional regulator [Pseudomonas rubra]MDD1157802.1 LysR family transcriptional regulator [Pseudomonas rubra]